MFGFGKRRRQEKANQEALAIGEQVTERVNAALSEWREASLEIRRALLDESYAERIVALQPTDELSFETLAEIEALALMKNWLETASDYGVEFVQRLDRDTLDCIAALEMGKEVQAHLDLHIGEVSQRLEIDLNLAITEALQRRGEIATNIGHRNFIERCSRDAPFVDSLNLHETVAYVSTLLGGESTKKVIAAMQRLYDIAFFQHGLPDEKRSAALSLAGGLEADLEAALGDNPEGLDAFQEAVSYQKERARHCGCGSLYWVMEEQNIPAESIIQFIAQDQYKDLLPAYLEMMEPDAIVQIRRVLVPELIRARCRDGESSIRVLHNLAVAGDRTLEMLFDPADIKILLNADADPAAAEEIVVRFSFQ